MEQCAKNGTGLTTGRTYKNEPDPVLAGSIWKSLYVPKRRVLLSNLCCHIPVQTIKKHFVFI